MKKVILIVLCCFTLAFTYSQTTTPGSQTTIPSSEPPTLKITKEHYTVSAGLLGAVDFTKFLDKNPANIDYEMETGWSAGGWINFPVGKGFSIEPQVIYNSLRYQTKSTVPGLLNNGIIRYVSIPLLFKIHAGPNFAFTFGPQVDITNSVKDKNFVQTKSDFTSPSFSATGGVELFPHSRLTLFGRYSHGITNMDEAAPENAEQDWISQNVQVGLKLKLFGRKVPADSDGDGISDPKDKCLNVAGLARYDGCPIPDTDNDGINDEVDKCINEPGTAKYNGCPIPDTDKDGINDEMDKCPTQPGTAKYNGCPIPDTDKDGVNDEEDKCPNEAGPASRQGCPLKDRDNDGVNDDVDRCPDVAGTTRNNGCPEVSEEVTKALTTYAHSITFVTGSAKLATKSNVPLNKIVTILKANPDVKVQVEGHTDNVGKDEFNMKLSEARAASVTKFLVSKGINEDRVKSQGFGESAPVAENTSAAGRLQNRRVEIKVDY